jgi:hypothetical protein
MSIDADERQGEDVLEESENAGDSDRKSPRERFLELAPKRTQAVIDKLRLLGNCGNRSTYRYEQEEVRQMFVAIEEELRQTQARFERREPGSIFRFR